MDISGLRVSTLDSHSFARLRLYPASGQFEIMAATRPIFCGAGWEEAGREAPGHSSPRRAESGDMERAQRRARRAVRDICLCNPMAYFCTLTIDAARLDRYDERATWAKMRAWLGNHVQRRGLKYVFVPEHHKDGAIHWHGLINAALPLADSGTLIGVPGAKRPRKPRSAAQRREWLADGARVCYNVPSWRWGFSTAEALHGDYGAAVSYVCKYIGKDMGQKIGGRWYYSGGDLARPVDAPVDATFDEIAALDGAYKADIPGAAMAIAIYRGKWEPESIPAGGWNLSTLLAPAEI